jgi:hypothetical protein
MKCSDGEVRTVDVRDETSCVGMTAGAIIVLVKLEIPLKGWKKQPNGQFVLSFP